MVSLRLVCGVSTLLTLAHQILAISEDTKASLNDACDKDFLVPIPPAREVKNSTVEECKQMIEEIPEDVNGNLTTNWSGDWPGLAALHKAALFGWVEVTKALIEAGADVNNMNRVWDGTALIIAAWIGRPKICEVLINAGADINMKNNESYGLTALQIAIRYRQKAVYDVLKKHGASAPPLSLPEILEFHGLASASEING